MKEVTTQQEAAALAEGLSGFQELVERHLAESGLSQTRYSVEAYGSVDFMRLLRAGRNFRMDTVARVLGYISRTSPPSPSTIDA